MKRVVVGIDGSAPDGPALKLAAREARVRGARLEVVSIWTYPPMSSEERMMVTARQVEDEVREVAARSVADAFGPEADRGFEVDVTVVRGAPAAKLLEAAEGSELLVVGRRDKSRVRHLLLGSVADQCVRHASCPTMVVPPTDDVALRDGPIIVGVDGSGDSLRALSWATEQASLHGLSVVAVFAWAQSVLDLVDFEAPRRDVAGLVALAGEQLQSWVSESVPDDSTVTQALRWGDPAEILVSEADGAALIVVGSRGLGGFTSLLLGSVSRNVANSASCPVVVLPRTTPVDIA